MIPCQMNLITVTNYPQKKVPQRIGGLQRISNYFNSIAYYG